MAYASKTCGVINSQIDLGDVTGINFVPKLLSNKRPETGELNKLTGSASDELHALKPGSNHGLS